MFKNSQNLIIYVVAALLVYLIFTTNGIRTDIKGYKNQIEAIQTKIDSTQTVNDNINTKIDSVKQNVVSITNQIDKINNNITIIKKQTDEKINTVDKFSNTELEFFFTNRYNEGLHSN